jgi:HSP20 family protein
MSLTLWKKRDPLDGGLVRLRDEMERAFDRLFQEPMLGPGWGLGYEPKGLRAEGWIPPLDMSETDTELTIRVEAPGIPAANLDISVMGHTLSIAGKKEEVEEKKDENFYQSERRFGAFRRVVDLPEGVDPDKVTAEADNGVVTIHIAKKPGVKPKHIEIKPSARKISIGV